MGPDCGDGLNGIDLRSKHTGANLATIDPARAAAEEARLELGQNACAVQTVDQENTSSVGVTAVIAAEN